MAQEKTLFDQLKAQRPDKAFMKQYPDKKWKEIKPGQITFGQETCPTFNKNWGQILNNLNIYRNKNKLSDDEAWKELKKHLTKDAVAASSAEPSEAALPSPPSPAVESAGSDEEPTNKSDTVVLFSRKNEHPSVLREVEKGARGEG